MFLIVLLLLIILLFLLWIAIHNPLKAKYDGKKNPAPGILLNYNNRNIHIYENLLENPNASVVLLSDNLTYSPYSDMIKLSNYLLKDYDSLIYEQPGHGWSDITFEERTISNMVREFHFALENSKLYPPYIIIAHSTSILLAIHYAQMHPENVQAIISLEGNSPYFYKDTEEPSNFKMNLNSFNKKIGLTRFKTYFKVFHKKLHIPESLDKYEKNLYKLFLAKNYFNYNIIDEEKKLIENSKIVIDNDSIGDISLIILLSKDAYNSDWSKSHEEFKHFSNKVIFKLLNNCDNFIQHNACSIINDEISFINKKQ